MFEESEIINLILGIVSLVIVYYETSKRKIPGFRIFLAGFTCIFMARVFTVAEGFFLENLLNIFEHVFYGLGAILFAAGCYVLARKKSFRVEG